MENVQEFPVKTRFGVAVYFTVAIWVWWWHGARFDLNLKMIPRD